ncbi:unnamed protein product, partial [marine sediment metagenome]
GRVVECGHTEAGKLFDCFNEVFSEIKDIKEFWILTFYDKLEYISLCYKFKKTPIFKKKLLN